MAHRRLNRATPKRVRRKLRKTLDYEWRTYWGRRPVQSNAVLYESFAGNGMLCNPEAIFQKLLHEPDLAHLSHVWVLDDANFDAAPPEFRDHPRVDFVRYGSRQYFRALATSRYLVNNSTFPYEFVKRPEQVYLNTWHGTPLKAMGYDEPAGGVGARNVLRNLVSSDFLLSGSHYMTERMYESAYRLRNVFEGQVIQEGSPRIDRQYVSKLERTRLLASLRAAGVTVGEGDTLVVYAPTWRGTSFHNPSNDVALLETRVRRLQESLPEGHRVLLKLHQQVYGYAFEHPELRDILVPNSMVTNQLLGITDVLVNDYSSIFFDFLATGRPVVFFTPDRSDYQEERGLYLQQDELPGPVVTDPETAAQVIRAIGTGSLNDPLITHDQAYTVAKQRFASMDDGDVTNRVVDIVWRGKRDGYKVGPLEPDGREKILIYLGGMLPNGITSSGLNLLSNIDHDRFDVSAYFIHSNKAEKRRQIDAIDPRVRVFPRVGAPVPSQLDRRDWQLLLDKGIDAPRLNVDRATRAFKAEWRRCFGHAAFDYIVDFSGYAPYWSYLLLQGNAKSHSVWIHNDYGEEMRKEVSGRRPHEKNLKALASMMPLFDHVVSVSSALNDENRHTLESESTEGKFTSARNTIRFQPVLDMAYGVDEPFASSSDVEALTIKSLPQVIGELAERYPLSAIVSEAQRRLTVEAVLPAAKNRVHRFVTVGRLAAEKNHARLLRAFDLVHQEDPNTELIIVGSGHLERELIHLANDLGLRESVTFAGQQSNPFAIVASCDTFVLSSDYEGQPMVLLEARILGRPIVSTNFGTVASALPNGTGLIVDQTPEALAQGMHEAIGGRVSAPPFDPKQYNREAIREFYEAIGVEAHRKSTVPSKH